MTVENTRQQRSVVSATTQSDKPSAGQNANTVRAVLFRWLRHQAIEWRGAIDDHRKWINSDRARALGSTFEVSGRLLTYVVYIILAYLVYTSAVGIRNGLASGLYTIPEHSDGSRVALFTILATGLVGPIAIIAIGIGIGWIYNLTTATASRLLPRFVQPIVHPSILFAVAAAFAALHPAVTQTAAKIYLTAKANIEAASPQETVAIKVIEIPARDVPTGLETTAHVAPSEREVARLRSMFNSGRPCSKDGQGKELNPSSEDARPEPGLAPNRDCQVEKPVPHE
jgi:hypothetical protein